MSMYDNMAAVLGNPASQSGGQWTLTSLIQFLTKLVGITIPVAVGVCILIFVWGVVEVVGNAEESDKLKEGRKKIFWSLLALFVVASLGGIVQILKATVLGTK